MNTQNEVDSLRQRIAQQEEEQGWNLSQNLYNRDWKKDLSRDKKALKALLKEQHAKSKQ